MGERWGMQGLHKASGSAQGQGAAGMRIAAGEANLVLDSKLAPGRSS